VGSGVGIGAGMCGEGEAGEGKAGVGMRKARLHLGGIEQKSDLGE
jgi:hypothetical protein